MNQPASGPIRRSPDWMWAVAAAIALALLIREVATAGSWLDEYWQLWISGAPAADLASRLATDAHPPWFNLFARPIVLAFKEAIVPARLLNLFAAGAALGAGLLRLSSLDRTLRWRIFLLLVASAGAVGMSHLALSFRAYVWLLALGALQAALLAAVVLKRHIPSGLAAAVTTASIAVHYVHAAGAIAIAMVSLALAWKDNCGAFRAILIGLIVGIALDVMTGLIQLPYWRATFDVNWIAESGSGGAPRSLLAVGVDFLSCNMVAAAMLAVGLVARRSKAALTMLAPIPIAFVGWLLLDANAPVLVPRYMASVTALLTTAAAIAWWQLALAPAIDAALAFLAALQPLASSYIRPSVVGWDAGARVAAEATRSCPGSRLYAVSAWRFSDHPGSNTERFEDPVIAYGYRKVGSEYGLKPQFVTGPTTIEFGRCPAIVWIEAAHGIEQVAPAKILHHAQLQLDKPAVARVIPTPNGAVLLISPKHRLQPQP